MNTNFKIVWFDDEESTINALKDEIQEILDKKCLKLRYKHFYTSDYDPDTFQDVDLVLADFDLGPASEANSVQIVNDIRDNKLVVDVLLYTSKIDKMLEEIQKVDPLLEGVYISKRGDGLIEKLERVIDKIDRRSQSIENFRGLVLEKSSIFEKTIYKLIVGLSEKYNINDLILEYINKDIADSDRDKIYKKCSRQCQFSSKTDCRYKAILVNDLTSIASFDLNSKSRILNKIIEILVSKENITNKFSSGFYNEFFDKIIIFRNALAHEESDERQLYLKSKNQHITIDNNLFIDMRNNIIMFEEYFALLSNKIDSNS